MKHKILEIQISILYTMELLKKITKKIDSNYYYY